jgi:long-chain acyl-CoA synthetase
MLKDAHPAPNGRCAINLSLNLVTSAQRFPEHIALHMDGQTLTHAGLDDATARLAAMMTSMGIGPGDRIGLMVPNVPEFGLVFYAALRCGAVVVPMNPLLKEREIAYYLGDSGATSLFAWHEVAGVAATGAADAGAERVVVGTPGFAEAYGSHQPAGEVVPREPSDTAVILYTSGTTGHPKGAELTHAGLNRNQEVTARNLLQLTPDDVIMGCLPLFHVFGLTCGLNTAIATGASLTLIPRFNPDKALAVIARDRVTVFEGVPTMYAAMLGTDPASRPDVTSLRVCISGGAAMPVEVMRQFEEAFGCIVLEGYGLSETSPVASFNHPNSARKPGSIGTPVEGVEIRLVGKDGQVIAPGEVGEIEIRGHNVMKSYWGRPQETAATIRDGWLATGDMARADEDGYFYIVDRKKDLIIRGGYNVYPREVEEVLYEHPAVAEAAVVGIPHQALGEEIGAAVVLKAGADVSPAELSAYVKSRLAAYKYPRRVWLLDSLPKGPTGKILRREVAIPPEVTQA